MELCGEMFQIFDFLIKFHGVQKRGCRLECQLFEFPNWKFSRFLEEAYFQKFVAMMKNPHFKMTLLNF